MRFWKARSVRPGLFGQDVPSFVKRVSGLELLELGEAARSQGFAACGRPVWTKASLAEMVSVLLIPICRKTNDTGRLRAWRCYAGVTLDGQGTFSFTIDISPGDFDSLPTVNDPWDVAEALLYHSPHLPIEE
ncbi:hypothetical protein [Nocardia sp. NPDC050406]|uniref:hypothetical protein n=1 Tax=Nocardia sp. NPDC050406 TaxID=3364318 RepID=UPI0037BD4C6F